MSSTVTSIAQCYQDQFVVLDFEEALDMKHDLDGSLAQAAARLADFSVRLNRVTKVPQACSAALALKAWIANKSTLQTLLEEPLDTYEAAAKQATRSRQGFTEPLKTAQLQLLERVQHCIDTFRAEQHMLDFMLAC